MKDAFDLRRRCLEHLKTLYLFGKSDILHAALPTMAVALVLAGPSSCHLLAKGFLWNQVHLLTCQVKNQIDGIEEDRLAKPYRPLPSGRITRENAQVLYHVLFASMWATAFHTGTIPCTLVYSVTMLLYNEGRGAAMPGMKNVLGAIGLSCFCWGTTVVLDHGRELHGMKALAILTMGAVFATTGHAQDFRDRSADALMGRKTIPLLLSQPVARWSLAALTTAWTVALIALWRPPVVVGVAFAAAMSGWFPLEL